MGFWFLIHHEFKLLRVLKRWLLPSCSIDYMISWGGWTYLLTSPYLQPCCMLLLNVLTQIIFYSFLLKIKVVLVKVLVHPKRKILSLITHPDVVPNPWDLRSSSEHKWRYFLRIPRALRLSVDSKGPYTIKVQKCSKEIGKIIHVTSGVHP